MSTPFRFGVQSFNAESAEDWAGQVQRAEELNYSAFHLADHIIGSGPALEKANHPEQNMAAIPAMAYAAAVTSTEEYEALGITKDEPKVRIDRLADVIEAVKAFCSDGQADLSNDTIKWQGFSGDPKPKSMPPIMICGGSPRILRLAGREADIVSLNFNNRSGMIGPDGVSMSTEEETQKKVRWIREGAGDRFDDLEIEIGAYFTFVMDDPSPVLGPFAQGFGLTEEQMRVHPHALFGSVDTICEELERRRELHGISYITIGKDNMEAFAPVVDRLNGK